MHVVSEGAICRCCMKYGFSKIVKNSQENTGVAFFNNIADLQPATSLQRDSDTGVFLDKDLVSRLTRKQELDQRNFSF